MGKGLNDLGLKDEALPAQSYDDLPTFDFQEPPQPGAYRFKIPGNVTTCYEVFDSPKGQRIRAIFDKEHPLTITQAKDPKVIGEIFVTRLSSLERARGKDKSVEASDLDYLLRAKGERARPTTQRGYIEALNKYAGTDFGADVTYSWSCNSERDIYTKDGEKSVKVEGTKGCGKKYYQRDVQKNPDGTTPVEIQCDCGAVIRAFANLDNFRA